eukprot:390127-Prymnesium_polylepis.1
MYARCRTPTDCDADVHPLGIFSDLAACQKAVNATTAFKVASYTCAAKRDANPPNQHPSQAPDRLGGRGVCPGGRGGLGRGSASGHARRAGPF